MHTTRTQISTSTSSSMAIWSPRSSPSPAVANQQTFCPFSSLSPTRTSLSAHQFSAANQLLPTLLERRRTRCSALRITAIHTCPPDTLNAAPARTLYEVLQVSQTATQAEIKASYRRLARLYHPDVHTAAAVDKEDSTKLFLRIHSAYSALSDEQSRDKYDLQLSAQALRVRAVPRPRSVGYNSYSKPRASPTSYSPCTSRIGRSWETDQCWC
eukprot:c25245_g4_i1 orf=237-875(-)